MTAATNCTLFRHYLSFIPSLCQYSRPIQRFSPPLQQVRHAVLSANAAKYKKKDAAASQNKKKKKARTEYLRHNLKDAEMFALCDAMRYIRAYEVGRDPTSSKYELHVNLRSKKSGPTIRNRLRLPHPVKTDIRLCVICPPGSKAAEAAKKAGAALVGEEEVFELVKAGTVEFDRCICHIDSVQKLNKAALGRILGPKGLMPSAKTGTIVKDVTATVREMVGGSEYREKIGTVRLAIGQLIFSPEELAKNIKTFMDQLKKDAAQLSDTISKEVHEVILSSTNSPGFTLSGSLRSPESVSSQALSGPP